LMQGLVEIVNCDNPRRAADVLFVHGLDGDLWETWHPPEDKDALWPLWLGEDQPDLGIWSYGYAAHSMAWKGSAMPLTERARNLLAELDTHDFGQRPIIFVTHSLGGLLVKQLLRTATEFNNPDWQNVARRVAGVVFLSTPHSGSSLATWMKYLSVVLRSNVAVRELQHHDPQLRDLNVWYRENVGRLALATQVFYEKQPLHGFIVVDETSADPGIAGVIPMPIDADHASICKCRSRSDLVYRCVRKFIIQQLAMRTEPKVPTPPVPAMVPVPPVAATPALAASQLAERAEALEGRAQQLSDQLARAESDQVLALLADLINDAARLADDLSFSISIRPRDDALIELTFSLHQLAQTVERQLAQAVTASNDRVIFDGYLVHLQHSVVAPISRLAASIRRSALNAEAGEPGHLIPFGPAVSSVAELLDALDSTDGLVRYEALIAIADQCESFVRDLATCEPHDRDRLLDTIWASLDVVLLNGKARVRPLWDAVAALPVPAAVKERWQSILRLFSREGTDATRLKTLLDASSPRDRRVVGRCALMHGDPTVRAAARAVLEPSDFWHLITHDGTPVLWLLEMWRHLKPLVSSSYLKVFVASVQDSLARPADGTPRVEASVQLLEEFFQVDALHEGVLFQMLMQLDDHVRSEAQRYRVRIDDDEQYAKRFHAFFAAGAQPDRPAEVASVPLPVQRKLARRGYFVKTFVCHAIDAIACETVGFVLAADNLVEFIRLPNINARALSELAKDRQAFRREEVRYALVANPRTTTPTVLTYIRGLGRDSLKRLAANKNCNQAARHFAQQFLGQRLTA
jgi:hypothetical protein